MSRVLDLWRGMTGAVLDYAFKTAPDGWLMCYGQALLPDTQYVTLRAALIADGNVYGIDGSGNPLLPDARGRGVAGKDDMGGTAALRLTASGGGVNGVTLGAVGGAETQLLTAVQLPSHVHAVFLEDPGHNHVTVPPSGMKALGPGTSNGFTSGSFGEYNFALDDAETGITIGDTSGGSGTANQTAANAGGGGAHNNTQPTLVLNKIIKT